MSEVIDLLIHSAHQLCTMPLQDGGPQRGLSLGDLGLIEDGALAIDNSRIVAVGRSDELRAVYEPRTQIDARGSLVTPGLVDPHTHAVWAGERAGEFERRIGGATYQQIMAEGGGINATMQATRSADVDTLIAQSRLRLQRMMQHGATTIEVKTGYGLDTESELNMLRAIAALDAELPVDLVPTFLGAHAIPPEYADDSDEYVSLVVEAMIPAVAAWKAENWPHTLFCDVFCETGAFSLNQTRRILEAAKRHGMDLKVHADEFDALGGTRLGVELGATTIDHLVATPPEEIQALGKSTTVAVSMPPTPFGLGHSEYTPALEFLKADAALAIATDCNPGTAWCESLQFVFALATRYLKLTQGQSLAAATVNAGFAVGRGGEIGTLMPGALGDVVIWQVDDYRYLGYRFGANLVQQVIKRGQTVYRQV
ncbi:MAG: imidazolonepropionase [Chloroflexi bacterium]|nr:imidazolonepropionase [Chloroflexota bacterium]